MAINAVALSVFLAWFLSQVVIKPLSVFLEKRRVTLKTWFVQGGMPSSHTSFVSSLALAIGLQEGFDSSVFLLGLAFAIMVIYDALVTRNILGNLSRIINDLLQHKKAKEDVGHSILEVIVGLAVGVTAALLVSAW